MKRFWRPVSFILFLLAILVLPGDVLAVENSDAFSVSFMPEPELSDDGLALYNAQTIGIVVFDPNPPVNQVRIPASDRLMDSSTATATIQFIYLEAGQTDLLGETCYAVPDDTKAAFNQAGIIWGNLLQSSVPIRIRVCWGSLASERTLGYSGGAPYRRDFTNVPRPETWYAGSLANSLAGTDLDTGSDDMHITFNNKFPWYTGIDANPPADKVDLVTVALHEICHGLNFSGSMRYASGDASWGGGTGYPIIYDTYMHDGSGNSLIDTSVYPNNSSLLGSAVTSGDIWFHGPLAMSGNGGGRVKMYAPTTWVSGSSYSHLDSATFASGNNRLMRYNVANGTAIHDPGPVAMGILKDLGWNTGGTAISECLPDIKANGQDGPLTVSSNTPVSITASLAPGNQDGKSADWWLAYSSPLGWYSLTWNGWSPGLNSLTTSPLFSIFPVKIFNGYLPVGDYTFYFAVDMSPNGLLDLPLHYDGVEVHVISPAPIPTVTPKPGTWNGSIVSFNVSSDSKTLTPEGSTLNYSGVSRSLKLYIGGKNCQPLNIYLSNSIPINANSFNTSGTFSDGTNIAVTGHFNGSTSASGTYLYKGIGSECSGSGYWTTNK